MDNISLTFFMFLIQFILLTRSTGFYRIFSSDLFINRLIQERFVDCEIIHTFPNNSVKHFSDQSFGIDDGHSNFLQYKTAGHIILNIGATIFFQRVKDVHKLNGPNCALILIHMDPIWSTERLSSWLFNTITPRYIPLIRKDEDYFIFVCSNTFSAICDEILTSRYGNKVKYKISINLGAASVSVKNVNLYGVNGNPLVGQLSFSNSQLKNNNDVHRLIPELFPELGTNFNQKVFRISFPNVPFYFEAALVDGAYTASRGLYKVWLDVVSERFNFTYELFPSSNGGGTGLRRPNGTWEGAVADVLYEKAEMAVLIGHIYDRHEFVEWSTSITYEWMIFIVHVPTKYYDPTAILRPFPRVLWAALLTTVFSMCLALKLISPYVIYASDKFSLQRVLQYIYASMLEVDAYHFFPAKSSALRVMLAFWLLFALVLSSAYKGKLVSLIAFPKDQWVPTTFEELSSSDYSYGLNVLGKGGAAYAILSSSKSRVFQVLFKKMRLYPDPVECIQHAMVSNMGCIIWDSNANYIKYRNFTDKFGKLLVKKSSQSTTFLADGYIWERQAVFRYPLDRLTSKMMDSGLIGFWYKTDLEFVRAKSNNKHSYVLDDGQPKKLQLKQFTGPLILVTSGFVLSCLSLMLEIITNRYKAL